MAEPKGIGSRLFRRFVLGSGPLKRGSDRLQVLARVLLVTAVVGAVPVALAVVTATFSRAQAVAAAEAADRHHVRATLVTDAAAQDAAAPESATVSWTAPSGRPHGDVLAVPRGATAGSTVRIWIDGQGDLTTRPATHGDVAAEAVDVGLATFTAISLVAVLSYRLSCTVQD